MKYFKINWELLKEVGMNAVLGSWTGTPFGKPGYIAGAILGAALGFYCEVKRTREVLVSEENTE